MTSLVGKTAVVTGGSRGLGRGIVEALHRAGARVVAVARDAERLAQLEADLDHQVMSRVADITDAEQAERILSELRPDILVLNAGAQPRLAPIHQQTWESFSENWNTDVKGTFLWTQQALKLPLAPGSTVLITSSGASIGGSPVSGGYAPAKRAQWIMTDYLQKASDSLKLGIRFRVILPRGISEQTELGRAAADAYARGAGLSREQFLARFGTPLTPAGFGRGVVEILTQEQSDSLGFAILENRVQPVGFTVTPEQYGAIKD